jgi:hypothetical protein
LLADRPIVELKKPPSSGRQRYTLRLTMQDERPDDFPVKHVDLAVTNDSEAIELGKAKNRRENACQLHLYESPHLPRRGGDLAISGSRLSSAWLTAQRSRGEAFRDPDQPSPAITHRHFLDALP